MSPGLAAMNDLAAAAGPFAQAARLLEELAGVRLTVKRAERTAETSGAAVAAAGRGRAALIAARRLVPLPPVPLPDKLYAAIDGTGVPMTARETAGRDGKGEDGRARTREVKLGVFFTQDKLDKDGYPVRDQASTSIIATFEPLPAFSLPGPGRGHPPPRRGPRPAAHHPRATAPPGSGKSPRTSSPRPPRSWTPTTPASTCTPSPGPWSSCCPAAKKSESPPASKTSTTATSTASTASRPPSAPTLEGVKKDEVE